MTVFRLDKITSVNQMASTYSGIPDIFLDYINEEWMKKEGNCIFGVILEKRSEHGWRDIGSRLLSDLIVPNSTVGLCIDGGFSVPTLFNWLSPVYKSSAWKYIQFKWTTNLHPTIPDLYLSNVECIIFLDSYYSELTSSIWNYMSSSTFNYGCDLMIVVCETNSAKCLCNSGFDKMITNEEFGMTLSNAIGWIIPIDGNIGFIIGLSIDGDIYKNINLYSHSDK